LIKTGKASHAYLGVGYGPVSALSPDDRDKIGVPADLDQGAFIKNVYPGSPAALAGLHSYDVITEVNGKPIADQDALNNLIQSLPIGSAMNIQVLRHGTPRTFTATLRERPASFGAVIPQQEAPQQQLPFGNPFGQQP